MSADVDFVKEQMQNHERLAGKYADQPGRAAVHLRTAAQFRTLAERLQSSLEAKNPKRTRVNVVLGDLEGLPDELMSELSISDADRQEMVIEDIIRNNDGVISLDKLLILYFKRSNEIVKRNTLVSKLYRMCEKGMIFNVPSKRGYYSVYDMNESDIKNVFGEIKGAAGQAEEPPDAELPVIEETLGGTRRRVRRRYARNDAP